MLQGVTQLVPGQPGLVRSRCPFLLGYLWPRSEQDISDPRQVPPRWRSGCSPASARRRRRRTDSDPRGRGLRTRSGPRLRGLPCQDGVVSTLRGTHTETSLVEQDVNPGSTRIDDRESRNRDVRGRRATIRSAQRNAEANGRHRAACSLFRRSFEYSLPVIVLARRMVYFQSTQASPGQSAVLSALVFAATLWPAVGAAVLATSPTSRPEEGTLVGWRGSGWTTLLIAVYRLSAIDWFDRSADHPAVVAGLLRRVHHRVPWRWEWKPEAPAGTGRGLITGTSRGGTRFIA